MEIKNKSAYEIVWEEELPEIHSHGTVLRHKKTGARVMAVENNDENKVFTIGFRTPPKDSTGVAHILEHSVLCGSREFPLKDPFVELVKGSLNTFLNAMTFSDKTIYPVASCNDQDFQNLMHVYLDAVFYPNIYKNEEIFKQEGWNYHIDALEGPLTYNGVVYNEMKGAFSSADEVFEREIQASLYPDNAYANESGGDPECIPDLTYEAFLDFHRKYYHPSNSFIYLYGDMDMEEKLDFIDKHYLSAFEKLKVDSAIAPQQPFAAVKDITSEYSISETDEEEENTYLSYNMVVDSSDPLTMTAFEVIDYALLSAPGAPLKQALLDAGIGKEVYGYFDDGVMQPYFIIAAKGTDPSRKEEFKEIILKILKDTVKNGINQKSVMAGINSMEFRYREADFGAYPKGLMYVLDILDSWLYSDEEPFINVKQLSVFAELKKAAGEGYFEQLIQKYLIDNTHGTMLTLIPKKGLNNQKEKALAEKLEALRESLSREDLEKMILNTKALKKYQETPDSPELLKCLPMLKRSDIKREAHKFVNEPVDLDGTLFLYHNVESNGIGYYDLMFRFEGLNTEEVHYLGLLKSVLGYIDTENYSYSELVNEINMNSGGIAYGVETFEDPEYENGFQPALSIRLKGLYSQTEFLFRMAEEVLKRSRLTDKKRLKEIISEIKSSLQMRIASAGHSSAVQRAFSYSSESGLFQDEVSGIGYLEFIDRLDRNFENMSDEISAKLQAVLQKVSVKKQFMADYSGEKESFDTAVRCVKAFAESLPDTEPAKAENDFRCTVKNEGIKTPGQVQYAAQVGNFKKKGYTYSGTLDILKVIMNYGYLWEHIRVQGGAYGCMSGFKRSGESYFVSYRDPKLSETFDVYKGIPAFVADFKADEREMTKYIIGTISGKDIPLTPHMLGSLSKSAYFNHVTEEQVQAERNQILDASDEDIRALAPIIEAILSDQQICVLGSESAVLKSAELFGEVRALLKEEEE